MDGMSNKIDAITERWADTKVNVIPLATSTPRDQTNAAITNNNNNIGTTHSAYNSSANRKKRKHIATSSMVNAAIKSQILEPRRGVSYVAIKKYIAQTYMANNVDMNKRVKFIKRYILKAVEKGKLIRTSGYGISGSFRLANRKYRGRVRAVRVRKKVAEKVTLKKTSQKSQPKSSMNKHRKRAIEKKKRPKSTKSTKSQKAGKAKKVFHVDMSIKRSTKND